jgi:hypothetical protein
VRELVREGTTLLLTTQYLEEADARVVSGRNLRHFARQRDLLVFSTIQPIMFVLLFTYVFGGAISQALPPA